MQNNKSLYNVNSIYPYIRSYNTKYWENLQKVMDASKTRAQSLELRRRWIQKQNKMNYQNEYDRLHGELSKLAPELQKVAVQNMMDRYKLEAIGKYEAPAPLAAAPLAAPLAAAPAPILRRPRRTREQIEEDKRQKEHLRLNRIASQRQKQKENISRRRLTKKTRVQSSNPVVDSV